MGFKESYRKMSGGSIAYHLRENKAIERNLFIDVLARIGRVKNISAYTYIGFGGPFLEDFKALHSALRIKKMISIELDKNVSMRQKFNKPASFIKLKNCTSGHFLQSHEFLGGNIVWLDYTAPSALYQQLSEFRQLIGTLGKYDVAKITLNASASSLGGQQGETLKAERRTRLLDRLGDYCKFEIEEDDVLQRNYPATLLKAVHGSLSGLASRESGEFFQILSAFVYKDTGQYILTVTGIMLNAKDDADRISFFEKSRIEHWPFKNLNWSTPTEISVPSLSVKERMRLDAALPIGKIKNPGDHLVKKLGYCPSEVNDEPATKQMLANYAKFYRAYPMFSKVVL
jgi:hypothetical protein